MSPHKPPLQGDPDTLLEGLLTDAHGDDEQSWALLEALTQHLGLPVDAYVVGEPVSLLDLDYDGNLRRGLTARCRRADGAEYRVSLADVALSAGAPGWPYLAAYHRWLGVEPPAVTGTASKRSVPARPAQERKHKAGDDDLDLSRPVDLVVLRVTERAYRCRLVDRDRVLTLRAGGAHGVVPGHIVTVQPRKQWRHAGHPYLSGQIVSHRMDARALGLVPLQLQPSGDWDPAEEYWGEEGEPIPAWARPIIAGGPRPMFEMEQVLPGADPEDFDSDPIIESNDLEAVGEFKASREILAGLLEADLRCLDAHAHLGNRAFRMIPEWALNHYEAGVQIGELSLGEGFDGVLDWGLVDNRPFLRCLNGYGLCLWRLRRWEEAEGVFQRMLWLNPGDNQGARFNLAQVRDRMEWVDDS